METATRLLERDFTPEVCYQLLPEWKGLDVHGEISSSSGMSIG